MFDDVMEVAHDQLHLLGQTLNIDKCEFAVYSADLDVVGSANGDGGMLSDDPIQALGLAGWRSPGESPWRSGFCDRDQTRRESLFSRPTSGWWTGSPSRWRQPPRCYGS